MQERASPTGTSTDPFLFLLETQSLAFLGASRRVRERLGYSNARLREMSLMDIVVHPPPEELRNLLLPLKEGAGAEVALGTMLRDSGGGTIPAAMLFVNESGPGASRIAASGRFDTSSDGGGDGPLLVPGNATFVTFAGRLGHDLNNLLGTIIGSLGLLREDGAEGPDEETRQLIDDALSAGRECADLVDRLMAAAGKQLLRPRRIGVNEIIERLVTLLTQTLPDNIDLQASLEPELPELEADPDRLEAAIIALVVNAREAMPCGGTLTISSGVGDASNAWPALEPGRRYVQVTVEDSGCGIPEEVRDRVLEPLFSTKSSGTGRGLGLSMVNGFVQQSHGALSLTSEPGRGTRVTLHFPPAE